MLNTTFGAVYRKLRKMAGLTQKEAARKLPISRRQLQRAEAGIVRLDPSTEAELVELAHCSNVHLVEMYCEGFSSEINKSVSIGNGHGGHRVATTLATAQNTVEMYRSKLSKDTIRRMNSKIESGRLMELTLQNHNAELEEDTQRCCEEAAVAGNGTPE